MKAMVLTSSRHMELQDIPKPELAPNGVLMRVEAAAICNTTDFRSYSAEDTTSAWPGIPCPVVLGHELCGRVVAVGRDVTDWDEGDRVVNWGVTHGAYAEYCHVLPEEVATFRVPESLPSDEAAVLEVVMGTLGYIVSPDNGLLLKEGNRVLVSGLGPSGLLYVRYAALCGASEIWAADHNAPRCDFARTLGATRVFSSVEELTEAAEAEKITMDIIVDSTSADLLDMFARLVRPDGLIVPYGGGCDWGGLNGMLGGKPIRLADGGREKIKRILPQIRTWLESGELSLTPLLSERVPLEETQSYLEALQQRPKHLIKVVLLP
jgi:L-iditol 2-dehydrogenase